VVVARDSIDLPSARLPGGTRNDKGGRLRDRLGPLPSLSCDGASHSAQPAVGPAGQRARDQPEPLSQSGPSFRPGARPVAPCAHSGLQQGPWQRSRRGHPLLRFEQSVTLMASPGDTHVNVLPQPPRCWRRRRPRHRLKMRSRSRQAVSAVSASSSPPHSPGRRRVLYAAAAVLMARRADAARGAGMVHRVMAEAEIVVDAADSDDC
jgi:hypothetical protein